MSKATCFSDLLNYTPQHNLSCLPAHLTFTSNSHQLATIMNLSKKENIDFMTHTRNLDHTFYPTLNFDLTCDPENNIPNYIDS